MNVEKRELAKKLMNAEREEKNRGGEMVAINNYLSGVVPNGFQTSNPLLSLPIFWKINVIRSCALLFFFTFFC